MADENWDDSLDELLGEVRDEYEYPEEWERRQPCVTAERKEWPDRAFYVLTAQDGHDAVGVDLDRNGWQQLRDLCELVISRIDIDEENR